MEITVYSKTTSVFCKNLRDYLEAKGIPFSEKFIDQDTDAKREVAEISGGYSGVPYVVVKGDNGEIEKIVGFDKGKLERILQISTNEHQ